MFNHFFDNLFYRSFDSLLLKSLYLARIALLDIFAAHHGKHRNEFLCNELFQCHLALSRLEL